MDFLDLTVTVPWGKAAWIAAAFAAGYALYRGGAWLLARRGRKTGWFAVGFLFAYTLAVSATVFHLQQRTERQQLQQWAERIARPRDLKSERLFAERVAALADDPKARALAAAVSASYDETAPQDALSGNGSGLSDKAAADSLTAYLRERYFSNHWRGYHFYLTLCRRDESLQIDSSDIVPCLDFFDEKTGRIGEATDCDGLYAMNYGVEYYSYLYRCTLTADLTAEQTKNPTAEQTADPTTNQTADSRTVPTADPTTDQTKNPTSDPTTAVFTDGLTAPAAEDSAAADTAATIYVFVEWGRSKLNLRRGEMPDRYSYAYYVDGALWSRRGHFLYDFDISDKTMATAEAERDKLQDDARQRINAEDAPVFIRENGYLHCVLKLSSAQLLVLTTPALKPISSLHYYSFFLVLFFAAGLLIESLRHRTLFKAGTYAQRLQYTVFGLVACAFAVMGVVSFFFIREIDRDEQTDRLKEKSLSALTALESRFMDFPPDEFPTAGMERPHASPSDDMPDDTPTADRILTQTAGFLTEIARVLSTDLYLFDRDGHFLLSNRNSAEKPKPLCRRPFFHELQAKNSHLLIREENTAADSTARLRRRPYAAGSLTAYAPFRNADNEILGYVMLPYDRFGRSWETVMHRYWGAYLNLFVWISLLTLLAAWLLARYVTRPLKLLSRQMGALQLTEDRLSAPPPLAWRSQDEIGSLVAQYNRMTAQLADSIRQLAEAERQNAWRQMARQVAHEIKNPLTPLQLQMQQLERAYRDRKPDFEERLARFGELLRTQIASLTRMADTFSQLAQWQQPQLQAVDLREAVESAAALFPAPTAFSFDLPDATAVQADPQWLRQILTNLLRNAIQAMEEAETPEPHIRIEASLDETCLLLHIRDNGPGIAPERQSRIYEPHFTTRSAGSGLGLAISRRLAEGMQGALTFAPEAPAEIPDAEPSASTDAAASPARSGAHFILQLPRA